jgi:hypothetical protein
MEVEGLKGPRLVHLSELLDGHISKLARFTRWRAETRQLSRAGLCPQSMGNSAPCQFTGSVSNGRDDLSDSKRQN